MRKALVRIAIALALGAGLWAGGWYLGRSAVDERMVAVETALEARGWTLRYGTREIGGFPTTYSVRLEDAALLRGADGMLMRAPVLEVAGDGEDSARLAATLPEGFRIDLPISESRRQADPSLPEVLSLMGTGEGLVITARPEAPIETGLVAAQTLSLRVDQDDFPYRVTLGATALALHGGTAGNEAAGAAGAPGLALSAAALALESVGASAGGPEVTARLSAEAVEARMSSTAGDRALLGDIVYGGAPGSVAFSYDLRALEVMADVASDPLDMDGRYRVLAVGAGGRLAVSQGQLEIDAESTGVRWQAEGAPGVGDAALSATSARLALAAPMSPSVEPRAGSVALTLEGVEADDALWQAIDPEGRLSRDPAQVTAHIDATLRLLARIDRLPPGLAPPYEISNILIDEVALAALGAEVSASGDVEIVQPIVVPTGTIAIQASGLSALAGDLFAAGLIDQTMLETAEAILQVYARPGPEPDSWQTELRTGLDGVTLNGTPLQ